MADQKLVASVLPPLSALMESATAAVIQLDVTGRVQLWNQASQRLFGWRTDEVLGKPAPNVPNDLWEDNQAWFLRCLGGQTMSGVQLKRRRKDGSTIDLHAWAWPVRNDAGAVLGVMKLFFPVGERTTRPEQPADAQLRLQTDQAHRFHTALLQLSKTDHPNLEAALQALTTVAGNTLNVERVGIWLFNKERNAIRCECLYQVSKNRFDCGLTLSADEYPKYFESLEHSRTIAASAARKDPRTREFRDSYLEPLSISSMLDVPIRLHGQEIGIVCHEHIGPERDWSPEEQAFAAAIADYVSLSFECQEHAQAELALRKSDQFLSAVIDGSPIGIQIFDQTGMLHRQNQAMKRLAGKLNIPSVEGEFNILSARHALSPEDVAMAAKALAGEMVDQPERVLTPRPANEGESLPPLIIDTIYYPIKGVNDASAGFACFHHDVSDRKRLEDQLQQIQRVESLGLLAGTIAHDFNGLLTAIMGFIDLALNEMPTTHVSRAYLKSGLQAAVRATDLTQQLLAYAGKGNREIKRFDLSVLVREVAELLQATLHEHGTHQLLLAPALPELEADITQIRQVVMNLITNAAESQSSRKGCVRIKTFDTQLDAASLSRCQVVAADTAPGHFVALQVSDEGSGIAPALLHRIFDPFFTTKTRGRGLGLGAVAGIIRGHKAALHVESRVGHGTSFTIYLPAASSP